MLFLRTSDLWTFLVKKLLKVFTLPDIILIIALLVLSGLLLANMKSQLTSPKIEIYSHNNLVGIYNLNKSQIIYIDEGIEVEISENKVRMIQNTCKHQYCVQQGWSTNLPIICVPNEIAVNFISKKDEMLITR